MNSSLQHIKVDIKCDINCDHSNCIQYALNLIHRNVITKLTNVNLMFHLIILFSYSIDNSIPKYSI